MNTQKCSCVKAHTSGLAFPSLLGIVSIGRQRGEDHTLHAPRKTMAEAFGIFKLPREGARVTIGGRAVVNTERTQKRIAENGDEVVALPITCTNREIAQTR